MTYPPTTWVQNSPPYINATNLNKLEQGIYNAHILATGSGSVVNVKDKGAVGNNSTNDAPAFQAAIDEVKAAGGGVVVVPQADYVWNSGVITHRNITLLGLGVPKIHARSITTPGYILRVQNDVTGGSTGGIAPPVAQNMWFMGSDTLSSAGWRTNLTGYSLDTSSYSFVNCALTGCDKGTVFEDDAYIITWEGCAHRWNNYGVYFDGNVTTNSGEKLLFRNCTIANNQHGIYNDVGAGMFFIGCSIDYNVQDHVAQNVSEATGFAYSAMRFSNCHLENGTANSTSARVINNGLMVFDNCTIFEEPGNINRTYFTNNGKLFINNGTLFRVNEEKYLVSGTGRVFVNQDQPIAEFMNNRFDRANSGIRNNGLETGDTTGWTAITGTNFASSATQAYEGTRSLRIASTAAGTATNVRSERGVILPNTSYIQMSCWGLSPTASTPTVSVTLRVIAQDGTTVLSTSVDTLAAITSTWTRKWSNPVPVPNGGYYDIDISIPAGSLTSNFAYLDEFYVDQR